MPLTECAIEIKLMRKAIGWTDPIFDQVCKDVNEGHGTGYQIDKWLVARDAVRATFEYVTDHINA